MGIAQYTDEAVTDKRNNGIVVLTEEEAKPAEVYPCIRCGECVEKCPMQLEPLYLEKASSSENWDVARDYYVTQCIECGLCSYVCPAKRALVTWIKKGKAGLAAERAKEKVS